jgi:RNA polymerase sigma-70 factor (ECF subfamily)
VSASPASSVVVDRVFREEHGRVIATLVRQFGNIDVAEEALQEAYGAAIQRWSDTGVPPNPAGWLITTARNRAIDRLRRESTRDARHREAATMSVAEEPAPLSAVTDDRLRLMFTCCHPALAVGSQVALTLRLLGGLTTAEIAQGFLVSETTMAQRLTRAKRKIQANKIPYRIPADHELPDRLRGVLAALFLVFNEGYLATNADSPVRTDLSAEAIRLARVLVALMPDEGEAQGLLALMLMTDARRPARFAGDDLVPLGEQDRSRWNRDLIAEGHAIVRACLRRAQPGPYQLLAAINAVHTDAAAASETDWKQIVALYDHLLILNPTSVVALNRAISIAEVNGPDQAMDILDGLDLDGYHPFHATRADLLRRLGRNDEAAEAYTTAIELATNSAEQNYLRRRRQEVTGAA